MASTQKRDLREKILSYIRNNPATTRKELQEKLGATYQAVQKQIKKLEREGLIRPGFVLAPTVRARLRRYWVFVQTRFDAKRPKDGVAQKRDVDYQEVLCREIRDRLSHPTVDSDFAQHLTLEGIEIVFGANWGDILITLLAEPDAQEHVGRFVSQFLRTRPNVEMTSTLWGQKTE